MTRVGRRSGTGFDLLGTDTEHSTSLVRNENLVRISYNDGALYQLTKNEAAMADVGTLLVADGPYLLPTGDRQSSRVVAKLLAPPSAAVNTKQIEVNGVMRTLRLLPVQLL